MKMAAGGRTATTAAAISILIISTSLLPSLHGGGVASAQGLVQLHVPQHHLHLQHHQPTPGPDQEHKQPPFGSGPTPSSRSNNPIGRSTRSTNTGSAIDGSTMNARSSTDEQRKHHHRHCIDKHNISVRVSIRCHCGAVDVPSVPLLLHSKARHDGKEVGQHDTATCTSCSSSGSMSSTHKDNNMLACYCQRCRKSAIAAYGAYARVAPTGGAAFFAQLQQENSQIISEHDDTCSHLGPVTRYRCGKCHSSLGLRQHHSSSADDGCSVSVAAGAGNEAASAATAGDDTGATWLAMGVVKDESVSQPIIDAWHSPWDDDYDDNDKERQHPITVACRNEKAAWIDARPNQSGTGITAAHIQPPRSVQQHRRLCVEGGCNCGSVRYEIDSILPHPEFQHCHCNLCRRLSGSAYMTWVPVDAQEFRWTRTDGLILMRTTPHGQRHACKKCGSILTIVYDIQPHLIWPAAGGFDDGGDLGSTGEVNERTGRVSHICCAWKAPWYRLPDDSLPRIQYAA
mmetsp:Transcript_37636/g.82424  ORF Transcript_37636/g.82424 Transcript_37636/m.82424 type:complete len:513 (+) Transcript_37636:134-1672(+)